MQLTKGLFKGRVVCVVAFAWSNLWFCLYLFLGGGGQSYDLGISWVGALMDGMCMRIMLGDGMRWIERMWREM